MRTDVSFRSHGTTCRGWLYRPHGGPEAAPAVLMSHGFSAVKEQGLDGFARGLGTNYIAAGFADLAHANSAGDFEVVGSVDPVAMPDGSLVAQTIHVEWIFDTPSGSSAILGLTMIDLSDIAPGEIFVSRGGFDHVVRRQLQQRALRSTVRG